MASSEVNTLLKDVTIKGVKPLRNELGSGAYGRVFTVEYRGVVCAAKEIHSILIENVTPVEKRAIIDKFVRECHHCSTINHPNIVHFLGVYYASKRSELPIMVMELMDTNLTSFVEDNQSKILMSAKLSILYDVSLGLSYLHARTPVVVHRDLSSNNVMLSTRGQLVAKIGDLGVAKAIPADSEQTRSVLTIAPGTVDFMPPESLVAEPLYGTAVDVFSFAGIGLHVFAEKWPEPCGEKRRDLVTKRLVALNEVERRQEYLDKIPESAVILRGLFERCLDYEPNERPHIQEVSEMIELLKV